MLQLDVTQSMSDLSASARDAAAYTIQSWYRRRRTCRFANRLLMWLHLVRLALVRDSAEEKKECEGCRQHTLTPVQEHTHLHAPPSPSISSVLIASSDASVVAHLLEAAYDYEAAKLHENYTRAVLLEELLNSSVVMQRASAKARHRLRQQHGALRHVSLSEPFAKAALENRYPAASKAAQQRHLQQCSRRKSELPPPPHSAPLYAEEAVARVLRDVEAFLSPPHFTWWVASMDGGGVSSAQNSIRSLSPAALQAHREKRGEPGCSDDEESDEALMEALLTEEAEEGDEKVEGEVEMDAACDAARRKAARQAVVQAARQATLAGRSTSENDVLRCTSRMETREVLHPDVSLEDVSLVLQPVLGSGVSGQWHRADTTNDEASSSLACVVCELEGILPGDDVHIDNKEEREVVEDVLVTCATCGAPVHTTCACMREAGSKMIFFCCTYCAA